VSDILKPSSYRFNCRNGVYGSFGDHIEITRIIDPIVGEDPIGVWYLVNFWVKFESGMVGVGTGYSGVFNFGNKFFCWFEFSGGGVNKKLVVSDFKVVGGVPEREYFETVNAPANYGVWEMWSVVLKGAFDSNGEDVLVYKNGVAEAVAPTPVAGASSVFTQEKWWTISSGEEWPVDVNVGVIGYSRVDLLANVTDFSIFVKETLPHAGIVSFLYNDGVGIDATEFVLVNDIRLGAYLPLRDGWANSKRIGKGRIFTDENGVVGHAHFNATPNVTHRARDLQGNNKRPLTARDQYLSHTRSNDKFVHRSVPAFDHQFAWINRSIPISEFPDAEGI